MSGDGADRSGEGRLARWSRLKRETRTRSHAVPAAAPVDAAPVPDRLAALTPGSEHPAPHKTPSEEAAPVELPPIESLDKDSDYTRFLKTGVPEDLKRQALRKLWSSDPAFMATDPYNVYNDDFTKFVPIDASKDTAYKIGRGFCEPEDLMTDEEKEAARRAKESADEVAADAPPSDTAMGKDASEQMPAGGEPGGPAGQLTCQETVAPGLANPDADSLSAVSGTQPVRPGDKLPDSAI